MCLRGHRSSVRRPVTANVDLALYSEGRLHAPTVTEIPSHNLLSLVFPCSCPAL